MFQQSSFRSLDHVDLAFPDWSDFLDSGPGDLASSKPAKNTERKLLVTADGNLDRITETLTLSTNDFLSRTVLYIS